MKTKKRVLIISFDFPPYRASSGVQRILSFCRHLPEQGWDPIVLTSEPVGYGSSESVLNNYLPEDLKVFQVRANDSRKIFSIKGKYLSITTIPDQWNLWIYPTYKRAKELIEQYQPDVVFSTFPYASSHAIGYLLNKSTGIPWVADFRDPMVQPRYPKEKLLRAARTWLEKKTVQHANAIVLTTPSSRAYYQTKFTSEENDKFSLIENGYEEDIFSDVEKSLGTISSESQYIVHSGTVYKDIRDPSILFEAINELKDKKIKLLFRASGCDDYILDMAENKSIGGQVIAKTGVDYKSAIEEMFHSRGLLVLQDKDSNMQIPAKIYEYMRAGKPILCLTDFSGDTYQRINQFDGVFCADIADRDAIKKQLMLFSEYLNSGVKPERSNVLELSRRERTHQLAKILNTLVVKV